MDLGVSSYQFDTPEKGFSYRFLESPLDMRLDQTQGITVAEYIKGAPEEELYEIFTKFGEEERARAIVHALIRTRQIKKITTVGQLLDSIDRVVGQTADKYAVYSRIFQSLRIFINDELGALREALEYTKELIEPKGRLAVISFHSLEDRIVKQFMRGDVWNSITKKPIIADSREVTINKRSRSAKLRIVERL
jgi:16S rRNA (cytosine1402-N4)-methyltransferase